MPTESAPPPSLPDPSRYNYNTFHVTPSGSIKCSVCGAGAGGPSTSNRNGDTAVLPPDPLDSICAGCAWSESARRESARREIEQETELGLGLRGVTLTDDVETRGREHSIERIAVDSTPERHTSGLAPLAIPATPASPSPIQLHSQSLPTRPTRPWTTSTLSVPTIPEDRTISPVASPPRQPKQVSDDLPNPLLDVTKQRIPSVGRGALYPGSVFTGTQTSGRSAYDVEVRLLDVNFAESTLSGYLSIAHLTEAHPYLTTFFTGEIIGPQYGFITGSRFGATEHDDMRHWGRFEQFRRLKKAELVQPDLQLRDPLPDRNKGETVGKERDFVFLRIKERFLVPDHTVKDISGASFAGFYFAMVNLAPKESDLDQVPTSPVSPTTPKSPLAGRSTSPVATRRMSSGAGGVRSPSTGDVPRKRRVSSFMRAPERPSIGEATIKGYYFHSLNQEPFQELCLTHVPNRSSSTFEMR